MRLLKEDKEFPYIYQDKFQCLVVSLLIPNFQISNLHYSAPVLSISTCPCYSYFHYIGGISLRHLHTSASHPYVSSHPYTTPSTPRQTPCRIPHPVLVHYFLRTGLRNCICQYRCSVAQKHYIPPLSFPPLLRS
jgi:hypothetical protein